MTQNKVSAVTVVNIIISSFLSEWNRVFQHVNNDVDDTES